MEMKCLLLLLFVVSIIYGAPESREEGHYDKDGKHNDEHDHKIFLGDKQQKEFENLTVEQSIERLGQLIDKIDKNGDGNLSEDELTDWIRYISLKEPSEKAKKDYYRIFSKQLKERDAVTWEDYLDQHFPGEHRRTPEAQKLIKSYQVRFNTADKDKDGKVTADEFVAYRQPHLFDYMHDLVASEVENDMDIDHDGKVTLQDRLAANRNMKEESLRSDFEYRDQDQNGVLDKEEIKEWYFPTRYDVNRNEARHLIKRADTNKDKVLTKKEIMGNHEVFVGSKATLWGETLKRSVDEL